MEESINKWYHEQAMSRMERTNKRLWVLCLILLIMLAGTNAGWIYYENQFEDLVETTTVTQDVDGYAENGSDLTLNTVGGDFNGNESESKANSK